MNILLAEDGLGATSQLIIGDQKIDDISSLPGGQAVTIPNIVNTVVSFLIPLSAIILFIFLVWGGFEFLTSYGEAEKIKAGKAKITSALIGFILLISSYVLVKIIANIFGLGSSMF